MKYHKTFLALLIFGAISVLASSSAQKRSENGQATQDNSIQRNEAEISALANHAAWDVCHRGGTPEKPLGAYMGNHAFKVFKSGYTEVPEDMRIRFAYDLRRFIAMNGGNAIDNAGGDSGASYEKKERFASWWWHRNCPEFRRTGMFFRGDWLNEAIVDATNIYEHWMIADNMTSTNICSVDADVDDAVKRCP